MRFFIDKIYPYRWIITIISITVLFVAVILEGAFLLLRDSKNEAPVIVEEHEENVKEDEMTLYQIDIKGAVKKPGVYSFEKGTTINDAITKAGGLKYNGTTKNINLSKKISNEMVLYIYTNSELKKNEEEITPKECVCETADIRTCTEDKSSVIVAPTKEEETKNEQEEASNISSPQINKEETAMEEQKPIVEEQMPNTENKKININEAGIEELMTLKGIGEKTAEKIIAYRNAKGKFVKIDDITNVSGIGASIFEKIKESITV